MPVPDLPPPATGLYGQPLKHHGESLHEDLPDGGHIIWQIKTDSKGKSDWRPVQYIPADHRIEV